jgi:hypothetical protein
MVAVERWRLVGSKIEASPAKCKYVGIEKQVGLAD